MKFSFRKREQSDNNFYIAFYVAMAVNIIFVVAIIALVVWLVLRFTG
jgi:flagellar biogenesis protein FliO